MLRTLLLSMFLAAGVAAAQTPDCVIAFNFNAAAQRSQITGCGHNTQGIVDWRVVYLNNGFSAVSVRLESAPDNSGSAGTWVAFVGTTVQGSNPMTATTYSSYEANGYNPWVSVTLTSATGSGTVSGNLYGCREPGCGTGISTSVVSSPCAGTAATPCVVDGPDNAGSASTKPPVQIAGNDGANVRRILTDSNGQEIPANTSQALADGVSNTAQQPTGAAGAPLMYRTAPLLFNGSTLDRSLSCPSNVILDTSSSGTAQIIAASGSTRVRICKMSVTTASAVDIQLKTGTGSNCGTGTANLSLLYQQAIGIAEDYLNDQSLLIGPASAAVCITLGAAIHVTAQVFYVQF